MMFGLVVFPSRTIKTPEDYFDEINNKMYFHHFENRKDYEINEIDKKYLKKLINKQITRDIRIKIIFYLIVVSAYVFRMFNFREIEISFLEALGLVLILSIGSFLITTIVQKEFQKEINQYLFSRTATTIDATKEQVEEALIIKTGPVFFWFALCLGMVCILLGFFDYFKFGRLYKDIITFWGLGLTSAIVGLFGLYKLNKYKKN